MEEGENSGYERIKVQDEEKAPLNKNVPKAPPLQSDNAMINTQLPPK